jgi:hypothetical protein
MFFPWFKCKYASACSVLKDESETDFVLLKFCSNSYKYHQYETKIIQV